jgi:nucleoside-diphosphate-sugar epimerase
MTDGMLLTGPLEPTNEWYAIAKIAGIKLFEAYRRLYGVEFISLMPTNPLRSRRQLPSGAQPGAGGQLSYIRGAPVPLGILRAYWSPQTRI